MQRFLVNISCAFCCREFPLILASNLLCLVGGGGSVYFVHPLQPCLILWPILGVSDSSISFNCVLQVCQPDIIFNFEKAYFILDEFLVGGEILETSKTAVGIAMEEAETLQEVTHTQSLNDAYSVPLKLYCLNK
uniref:AP complex mu/sigma subunit domain-containing protein n=1 Tax=Oncorhynchus mykiss TaxID=8022 RepID=A0A8K9XCK5_ONCMY